MPNAPSLDLVCEVAQACRDLGVLQAGSGVLVAVSAGADSTALAALLAAAAQELEIVPVLAHVDHGWRGAEEAAADWCAVEALGARLDLPTHRSSPPPAGMARTEDAARRWRYRCLAAMAHAAGCAIVATGHHSGDQAETLLMRLLRGSGLVGLAGIPPVRGLEPGGLRVIRPLLGVEPGHLRAWLLEQGLSWREDRTNEDLSRDRVAIRARLAAIPARPHQTLARLATRLRRRLEWREAALRRALLPQLQPYDDAAALALDRTWLRSLSANDLALVFRVAGPRLGAGREGPWLTQTHISRMEDLLEREGAIDLPQSLHFHVRGRRAWLVQRELPDCEPPTVQVDCRDRVGFDLPAFLRGAGPREAALDAGRLGKTPRLRRLRSGDRFIPQGRGQRSSVDIAAWMARRGLSHWVRRGQWVLEGQAGIAWVVGERVDAGHAISVDTLRVAHVCVGPAGSRSAARAP